MDLERSKSRLDEIVLAERMLYDNIFLGPISVRDDKQAVSMNVLKIQIFPKIIGCGSYESKQVSLFGGELSYNIERLRRKGISDDRIFESVNNSLDDFCVSKSICVGCYVPIVSKRLEIKAYNYIVAGLENFFVE